MKKFELLENEHMWNPNKKENDNPTWEHELHNIGNL